MKLYKVIEKFHEKHQASEDSKQQAALRGTLLEVSATAGSERKSETQSQSESVAADRGARLKKTAATKLPSLKARDLMPSYKMVDVTNFLRQFLAMDTEFNGTLDVREWVEFFTSLNSHVDQHYAKLMFYQLDTDGNGELSIDELLPVIFVKASKEQLDLIEEYMEYVISKQQLHINHSLTEHDLQCLFEYYDADMIGFVKVGVIRKIIMALQLPGIAHDEIMYSLKNIDADEMFSEMEFIRIFKQYLNIPGVA